jgi:hypothetical protein
MSFFDTTSIFPTGNRSINHNAVVRETEVEADNVAFPQHFFRFVRDAMHDLIINRDTERRRIGASCAIGRVTQEGGRIASVANQLFGERVELFGCHPRNNFIFQRGHNVRETLPCFYKVCLFGIGAQYHCK